MRTAHPYPLKEKTLLYKFFKPRPTNAKTESEIGVILGGTDPIVASTKYKINDLITTCLATFMLILLMCYATQRKSLKNVHQYKATSCEVNHVH